MTLRGGSATMTEDPSHYLSSSISSLSSQRAQSSWIARTYRHAAQLYLTRRLSEALEAIEPVITPEHKSPVNSVNVDGNGDGVQPAAPVAASSRGTRVKVWSFYLTLLNAIIELGPEEGKLSFGSTKWRAIAAKARDGIAWEDVVRYGYGGSEGEVDGEVVANLATLLLTHMPTQRLNQQRLETYLSASANPSFDIAAHLAASQHGRPQAHRTNSSGTDTPRDLNTRLKLLELYTLHVLPRNEEWDYAREFINMSEILDEERREAFLFALTSLREEKEHDKIREEELEKRQEEEMEQRRKREEEGRLAEEDARRRRTEDEQRQRARRTPSSNASSTSRTRMPHIPGYSNEPDPPNRANGHNTRPQSSSTSRNNNSNRPKPPPPPQTLFHRASHMLSSLQDTLLQARTSMSQNPASFLRMLLLLFALATAFARRDIRERIRRLLRDAWESVKRTVGMGVKVSYI